MDADHPYPMQSPPPEMSAEIRIGARQMFGLFAAYIDAGFHREEAIQLMVAHIRSGDTDHKDND